jgi:hypothetical protein
MRKCLGLSCFTVAFVGLGGLLPSVASTAQFSLTCEVVDAVTQLERSTFAPGDSLGFSFSLEIPPEAADQEINVKLSARVFVAGLAIPISLDELKLSVPNQQIPQGVATATSDLPVEGVASEQWIVDIPQGFPEGSATLRAKFSIETVGKQSCEVDIQVEDPPL